MERAASVINSIIWSDLVIVFIIAAGVYFTVRSKFFQLTKFKSIIKNTIFSKRDGKNFSGAEFRSMTLVLASCVGTGNISGVASAIITGGPGAIFWMWVSAFFGMMTSYTENALGFRYRKKENGVSLSGGMYYIKELSPGLSYAYSALCVLSSMFLGNAVQTGALCAVTNDAFGIKEIASGLVLTVIIAIIVFSGAKKLMSLLGKIVPFAALFYIISSMIIVIKYFKRIPLVITEILYSAFGLKSISGGITGFAVKNAVNTGLRRGVFSNEAGLGVSPMAHASAEMKDECIQGSWGILEVFIDTLLMCTVTAFSILCSDTWQNGTSVSADIMVNTVFGEVFGQYGIGLGALSLIMFAFMTVAGWWFYGEKAWAFLFGKKHSLIYKILYVLPIPLFAVAKNSVLWSVTDIFNGLMIIINLSSMLVLSPELYGKNSVKSHKI